MQTRKLKTTTICKEQFTTSVQWLITISTAHDVVWNYYLQNPGEAFFEDFLTTIGLSRHDTDTLYKRQFTNVHRIVLGLLHLDLDEYLTAAGEEIDRPDHSGKTPLCWATSRPDPSFVEILLRRGASLLISDRRKQTPLHYCAGSGNAMSMRMLLEAVKHHGLSDFSAESGIPVPDASLSIINAKDSKGRTPLNLATRMDFPIHAQLLISAGADMEAPDEPLHRTIVLTAIYWNSHTVLPILLENGARTDQRDAGNASILHYAARYANLKTLQCLSQHDLGKIDIDARDDGGLTALQVFGSSFDRVESESEQSHSSAEALFARILLRHKYRGGGYVDAAEETDDASDSDASFHDFDDANADLTEGCYET